MAIVIFNNKTQETKRVSYVWKNEDGSLYFCNRNFTHAGSQFKKNWEGILTVSDEGVNGHFPVTLSSDWTVSTQGKGNKGGNKVGSKAAKMPKNPLASALLSCVNIDDCKDIIKSLAGSKAAEDYSKAVKASHEAQAKAKKAEEAAREAAKKASEANDDFHTATADVFKLVKAAIETASQDEVEVALGKALAARTGKGKPANGKDGKGKPANVKDGKGKPANVKDGKGKPANGKDGKGNK